MTTQQLCALLNADPGAVIAADRARYEAQIQKAADLIAANAAERPIVLLAGPSGSGKTTTALLIERELERRGMVTHTLQMDDWFCTLTPDEIRALRENALDLERPDRVDISFFRQQLDQLLAGETIELPRYNFKKSRREFDGRTLCRKPGELVIMEGIHALNPAVTGHLDTTTRVYVSVRTRIAAQDDSTLHPSMIRLARRLLRDRATRGRPFSETIAMRGRVDAGEQRYIMPFKPNAHCSIDSFYSCELSVYRDALLPDLPALAPQYPDLAELLKILRELPAFPTTLVPQDSLLREFIGGSTLSY